MTKIGEPVELGSARQVVASGFRFTECPRWRADEQRLYFVDMFGGRIHRMDEDGDTDTLCEFPGWAGGIGFLGDDMLVASMRDSRILRLSGGELSPYADLSPWALTGINDMFVDPQGRCYVSRFPDPVCDSPLIVIDPSGNISEGATALSVANGIIAGTDAHHLFVAECAGGRIARVELDRDGAPVDHRAFAQMPPGYFPDGICRDEQGGVWAACARGPGVIRVVDGGVITHQVTIGDGRYPYACELGGRNGDTLFLCVGNRDFDHADPAGETSGSIEAVQLPPL